MDGTPVGAGRPMACQSIRFRVIACNIRSASIGSNSPCPGRSAFAAATAPPRRAALETRDESFAYDPDGGPGSQGRWQIHGLGLPAEVLEAVYAGNARRLIFGSPPGGTAHTSRPRPDR